MSDEYKKKFNEYLEEHSSILEIMKGSEFFQAILKKAEEDEGDTTVLHKLAEQHASEAQPILDNFLEVMSDPFKASEMLKKLGRKIDKKG